MSLSLAEKQSNLETDAYLPLTINEIDPEKNYMCNAHKQQSRPLHKLDGIDPTSGRSGDVPEHQICMPAGLKLTDIISTAKEYLEQEEQPPGLGPLTPLAPQLQPLICLLHCHEFLPPLGVLVRMVLPCQLPA